MLYEQSEYLDSSFMVIITDRVRLCQSFCSIEIANSILNIVSTT